jgi:CheY-like chemotaxis protein
MPRLQILLVEDEDPKRTHIARFLEQWSEDIELHIAKSVNSALDSIDESRPDLLLLDMSLPTFDIGDGESGGRPQGFGGIEVLRQITMADIVCPTVVITGYEAFLREAGKPVELSQLREELRAEFPHLFRGILHYNSTVDGWKIELLRTLEDLGVVSRRQA